MLDFSKVIETNEFGFDWANAAITRIAEIDGHRILEIQTPKEVLQLRITPSGLIRVGDLVKKVGKAVKDLAKEKT